MNAKYFDTYCIGHMIRGRTGEVTITKTNKKSFHFEGMVHSYDNGFDVKVSGVATFWKQYKDGNDTISAYKCGSAVLKIVM